MPATNAVQPPSPFKILSMMNGYQETAAMKAAVDIDLFSAIAAGGGKTTVADLAQTTGAAERGIAALADFLVVHGVLTKQDGAYGLTPDAAMFLDRRSPACLADTMNWWSAVAQGPEVTNLTAAVRRGGADNLILDPETWVLFARSMAPMMRMPSQYIADNLAGEAMKAGNKVLDIAGGHGLYGIAIARKYPKAEITLVDAEPVAAVAKENAQAAGVADRYHALTGSALPGTPGEVVFGEGYALILITGFLHHFTPPMIEKLLAKTRAALAPNGQVIALDFVPNEDRVSPPFPASFSLTMLAVTSGGNAYTYAEYEKMFANAGFGSLQRHDLPALPMTALIAKR